MLFGYLQLNSLNRQDDSGDLSTYPKDSYPMNWIFVARWIESRFPVGF